MSRSGFASTRSRDDKGRFLDMGRQMNIWTHEEKALDIWLKHYDFCAERLDTVHNDGDRQQAIASFRDCIQVKLLHDGSVKVKWEHQCWWADCKQAVFAGQYYCVLAHPKNVTWTDPYQLAKELAAE